MQTTTLNTTEANLWANYSTSRSIEDRNRLVHHYRGWIRVVAAKMRKRLTRAEYDDLFQSGQVGLIDAIDRYRVDMSTPFTRFARRRVVGQMVDDQRLTDWVSRSVRLRQRRLNWAMNRLRQRLDREPTILEVADELGVPRGNLRNLRRRIMPPSVVNIDALANQSDPRTMETNEPIDHRTSAPTAVAVWIDCLESSLLTPTEQQVLELRYRYGESLTMMAPKLGRSACRLSQLHTSALKKLRRELRGGLAA